MIRERAPYTVQCSGLNPEPARRMRITAQRPGWDGRVDRVTQKKTYKPSGLWYACGWEWMDFIESGWRGDPKQLELYELAIDKSRVLLLKNFRQIREFNRRYGEVYPDETYPGDWFDIVDWSRVARDYDGIELCPFNYGTKQKTSLTWFSMWDVASGCIWNQRALSGIRRLQRSLARVG